MTDTSKAPHTATFRALSAEEYAMHLAGSDLIWSTDDRGYL